MNWSTSFSVSLLLGIALALAGGCDSATADRGGTGAAKRAGGGVVAPTSRPTSFTGTLRGSAVAIGGETTGWRLEGDNQTGGLDVDISKVRRRAQALDGKRVILGGKMTIRAWPERGDTQVLVVDRIEEATPPDPTRRR